MAGKNNWLICGTSPFATEHLGDVNYDSFITVGLNSFPIKCSYRFFVDYRLICCYTKEDEKLVIPKDLLTELKYYNNVGRECLLIEPYYTYTMGNELSCINSVCEPAIEYAYKQGADNIILFGVDLGGDFQPKEQTDVTKAIIRKYGNVYTLNKESGVGVPTWTEINLS